MSKEKDRAQLVLSVGDASVRLDIRQICSDHLVVSVPAHICEEVLTGALEPGSELSGLHLEHGDDITRLQSLSVVDLCNEGGIELRLQAGDDATKAALWLASDGVDRRHQEEMVADALNSGVDSIPARGRDTELARMERLDFIRDESGAELSSLEETSLMPRRLTGNIENLVGSVEVPVGIAGPLLFRGQQAQGVGYAPLATTEGTLVASASRGARALTRSGGVVTRVIGQRMLRAPLFVLSSLDGALLFARWIRDHRDEIANVTGEVSRHARLIELKPLVLGRHVHLTFLYETGDAAGQNMTTSCTWHACQWLLKKMRHFEEVEFENFVIEANMSSDKKVTYQSFVSGRGTRVIAEAFLEREALEDVLKVSPEQLLRTTHAFMAGSIQAGMVGFNINVANIVAAVYTATGQDIGCVHESSLGQLYIEAEGDGVVASLLLPGLIVGTVGGGTQLPKQQDYLELMGCAGSGKAARFAELIAGFCLALDLSTLSAIASGQFAQAHERLGRNRPVEWLKRSDLDAQFFQRGLQQALDDSTVEVEAVEFGDDSQLGSSIITELTSQKVRKLVGLFPITITYGTSTQGANSLDVIAKVKPIDDEIILMLGSMASMCGRQVGETFARHKGRLDFTGCDIREIAIYQQDDPRFVEHTPQVYQTLCDGSREAFVIVMEHLQDVMLVDTADDTSVWKDEHIVAALEGIAAVHAIWYERTEELREEDWLGPVASAASMADMSDLWGALNDHARREFPQWISREEHAEVEQIIDELPSWYAELENCSTTLVHNDFNPRNICLRRTEKGPTLCAYDWELATVAPPQRDLAEFLAFVLSPDVDEELVSRYLEIHRSALQRETGHRIDSRQWRRGYGLCLLDLTVNRFGLYLMAHTFRQYGFLERSIATLRRLRAIEEATEI